MSVAIVGAGPTGLAAAISLARKGIPTTLIERRQGPSRRPGETLHPGIEPIFDQLGVGEAVRTAGFHRHKGSWITRVGDRRYEPFGGPPEAPWLGFQAPAVELDRILLEAAQCAGAKMVEVSAKAPLVDRGRIVGVQTRKDELPASWVIDASGGGHWLARCLKLQIRMLSPQLRATYGYSGVKADRVDPEPELICEERGWRWQAPLGGGRKAWVRLLLDGGGDSAAEGGKRANVTWRRCGTLAGPGYLIAGDAAGVLDPASSHGVLRALMSGMMAAQTVLCLMTRPIDEAALCVNYTDWLGGWLDHDADELARFYAQAPFNCIWAQARTRMLSGS